MTNLVNLLPRERAALSDRREWRGRNALGNAARALVDEGAYPDAKMLSLRDGRPALEGTIAAFAGRQWAGADADPQFRPWRPHPRAQMPPRLVAWATENGFLPPGRYHFAGAAAEDSGEQQGRG
jgi:hypothetical protein